MRRVGLMVGVCSVAVGLLCLTQSVCPSQAEMYVAGQFGVTFPNNATNLEGVDSAAGLKLCCVYDRYSRQIAQYNNGLRPFCQAPPSL